MNDVFLAIKAAGLNPIEFAWKEEVQKRKSEYGPSTILHLHRLPHKPSGYSFLFGQTFVSYTPGSESQQDFAGRVNWAGKQEAVGRWLTYLKREIEAPDLCGSLVGRGSCSKSDLLTLSTPHSVWGNNRRSTGLLKKSDPISLRH
jgi:hypothetical protein